MTLWRDYYDPGYLSPDDLEEPVTVTIESIEQGVFEDTSEDGEAVAKRNPVVHFKGTQTVWRVNRINEQLLEALFGKKAEDAIGHKVTLAAQPNEVKGAFLGLPSIRVVGSPELEAAREVEVKLPRRRPFKRTLTPTAKSKAPPETTHEPEPEPPPEEVLEPAEEQFLTDTLPGPEPEPVPDALKATKKQLDAIRKVAIENEIPELDYKRRLAFYGATKLSDLTAPQADLLLADFKEPRVAF